MTAADLTAAEHALVSSTPLFAGLDHQTVGWLIAPASVTDHPQTGLLFSQGDKADRFFLTLQGRVNLFTLAESGQHSIIEVIEAGQTFAEAVMFMNGRFPLNAEVAAGSRLLTIPAAAFLSRLGQRQDLATQMFAALARWQRRLIREIAMLKGRTPAQRVGLFLLARCPADSASIRLPMTMGELASRIGITPERLSRVIARLRPLGISSNRNEIVIADADALRRFCQTGE